MESLEKEGVMRIFIAMPNLRNISIHSATSSCIIELYEKWYTFPDFFPNSDCSRSFLHICIINIRWKPQRNCMFMSLALGDELERTHRRNGSELIEKWVTYLVKTTL
jgi:hypothetical protein